VLRSAYTVPIKEDFRGASAYLKQQTSKDDAILIMAGYVAYGFLYYGVDGQAPVVDVTSPAQVEQALAPVVAGHRRLWFVQSHYVFVDPNGYAEKWLNARCRPVGDRPFVGIKVTEFACEDGGAAPPPSQTPQH
jgi:hypothetical protein